MSFERKLHVRKGELEENVICPNTNSNVRQRLGENSIWS
jgi:hypothetical protein